MKNCVQRRCVLSWALYDWARAAYGALAVGGLFTVYYGALADKLSPQESQFFFGVASTLPAIVFALLAPVIGAIADRAGRRKRFLLVSSFVGALTLAGLGLVTAGQWLPALILYALASFAFSSANMFYDSMLLDVTDERNVDMVSALGIFAGYLGGALLPVLTGWMAASPEAFGLAGIESAVRLAFVGTGVWWVAFSIPLMLYVRETPTQNPVAGLAVIRAGWRQLLGSLREFGRFRMLTLFLVSYWLYVDGARTIVKAAAFYSGVVLGLPTEELMFALVIMQVVALPATLVFGWLGGRIGPKPCILIGLAAYIGVLLYSWRWLDSVGDFRGLAVTVGLVQGGVLSLSRSLFARMAPVENSAQFFGLFNVAGSVGPMIGPLILAAFSVDDPRNGIGALTLMFLLAGALLWRVDVHRAKPVARGSSERGPSQPAHANG